MKEELVETVYLGKLLKKFKQETAFKEKRWNFFSNTNPQRQNLIELYKQLQKTKKALTLDEFKKGCQIAIETLEKPFQDMKNTENAIIFFTIKKIVSYIIKSEDIYDKNDLIDAEYIQIYKEITDSQKKNMPQAFKNALISEVKCLQRLDQASAIAYLTEAIKHRTVMLSKSEQTLSLSEMADSGYFDEKGNLSIAGQKAVDIRVLDEVPESGAQLCDGAKLLYASVVFDLVAKNMEKFRFDTQRIVETDDALELKALGEMQNSFILDNEFTKEMNRVDWKSLFDAMTVDPQAAFRIN